MSGRLEVVDLSAHGGGALAPQELLQQQLQQVSLAASARSAAIEAETSTAVVGTRVTDASAAGQATKLAFSCNTCAAAFADAAEHRAHFKCPPPPPSHLLLYLLPITIAHAARRLLFSHALQYFFSLVADLIGTGST